MLVLLSSGARARYREDIIRALALPRGADLQFRYERALLHPDVAARVDGGGYWYEPALIAYLWNQAQGVPTSVVPCRLAFVRDAQFFGSTCVFSLVVQSFADLDDARFRQLLSPAEVACIPAWQQAGAAFQLNGHFVFPASADFEAQSSTELRAFERTVAALRAHPDFLQLGGDVFYSVRGVRSIGTAGAQAKMHRVMSEGAFSLKTGPTYELVIYCFSPPGGVIEEHALKKIQVDADEPVEFPTGKTRDVDSEYDIKTFRFHVPLRATSVDTAARVFVTGPGHDDAERADVLLPLVFAGARWLAATQVMLIAVASAVPAMLGVWAAGKPLSLEQALAMLMVALGAALGIVFTSLKRT